MPLYSELDFNAEIKEAFNWTDAQIDAVKNCALSFNRSPLSNSYNPECTWDEFREFFSARICEIVPLNADAEEFILPDVPKNTLPNYNDFENVSTLDEAKACLDRLRKNQAQLHLENYLLQSQTKDEDHNYFALMWKGLFGKTDYPTFLLLYCQLLLTQHITNKMMCSIIIMYGKFTVSNDWVTSDNWIDSSLNTQLNDTYDFEVSKRTTKLKIAYCLRLKADCYDPDGKDHDKHIMTVRNYVTSMFGEQPYDPRSFYEMLLLYITYRNIMYSCLGGMIVSTAKIVLRKLLPDEKDKKVPVSEEKIENYAKANPKPKILDLTSYQQADGVLCECAGSCEWNYLKNFVKNKLIQMKAPAFATHRPLENMVDTEVFFSSSISDMLMLDSDEFVSKLANDRNMYAYYDDDYASRFITMDRIAGIDDLSPLIEKIYFENSLETARLPKKVRSMRLNRSPRLQMKKIQKINPENLKRPDASILQDVTRLGSRWKKTLHSLDTLKKREVFLRKTFTPFWFKLRRCSDRSNLRDYRELIPMTKSRFISCLAELSYTDDHWNLIRSNFLLDIFNKLSTDLDTLDAPTTLMNTFDNSAGTRFKKFDFSDYHDVFLFMCCLLPDRIEAFKNLEEAGYLYNI